MSLYGLPKLGSVAIAFRHSSIASSTRPAKEYAQPRKVYASAVGRSSSDRLKNETAPSQSPAMRQLVPSCHSSRAFSSVFSPPSIGPHPTPREGSGIIPARFWDIEGCHEATAD